MIYYYFIYCVVAVTCHLVAVCGSATGLSLLKCVYDMLHQKELFTPYSMEQSPS
jgi:hypothetical protein